MENFNGKQNNTAESYTKQSPETSILIDSVKQEHCSNAIIKQDIYRAQFVLLSYIDCKVKN